MIHLIYTYIIINSFFVGLGFEDFKADYKPMLSTLILIFGLFFALPFVACYFGFHFLKLVYQKTWLANYVNVMLVIWGYQKINSYTIKLLNAGLDRKNSKQKLTISDKIYIWGANKIIAYYIKTQAK